MSAKKHIYLVGNAHLDPIWQWRWQEGSAEAYVREEDAPSVAEGMTVVIGDGKGTVTAISAQPITVDEAFTEYMRHIGGLRQGEWVYVVTLETDCADGVYAAQIVVDSVSPMAFVLN